MKRLPLPPPRYFSITHSPANLLPDPFVGGAVSGHIFAARTVDAAAAAPRMVTAQKFMLVDRHGKTRGEFNVTRGGVAQIAVFDGSGTLRAGLGVGSDGAPALGIYGNDGKPRA